jgi:predicted transcriptional regulator
MKTIKQIADDLGVSKQAVRNSIAKLGLQSSLRKNGNSFAIDERQETLIYSELSKESNNNSQSESQGSLQSGLQLALRLLEKQNEQLSLELEIKNKQIEALTAALENTTESLRAAQALHAGTLQKQLTDGALEPDTTKSSPKAGFFKRVFDSKKE